MESECKIKFQLWDSNSSESHVCGFCTKTVNPYEQSVSLVTRGQDDKDYIAYLHIDCAVETDSIQDDEILITGETMSWMIFDSILDEDGYIIAFVNEMW